MASVPPTSTSLPTAQTPTHCLTLRRGFLLYFFCPLQRAVISHQALPFSMATAIIVADCFVDLPHQCLVMAGLARHCVTHNQST